MAAFLQFPDLNIEIICNNGRTRVRDLSTGEERDMVTSTTGVEESYTPEQELAEQEKT